MQTEEGPCGSDAKESVMQSLNQFAPNSIIRCASGDPTVLQALEEKRARLALKIAELDAAIEALKANPETEKILSLLAKVRNI